MHERESTRERESHCMTSSVTGRMGKVRHNSLNQSDCPPPLRPPHTNNNAFVSGCTPLARSHTPHTTHHTPHTNKSKASYTFSDSQKQARAALHCITDRMNANKTLPETERVFYFSERPACVCTCPCVLPSSPGHMTAAAPSPPCLNRHPSLL